jgi:2-keto-4-pentenoate hydratase/2-oxohepta-3-ene-1,7-dioic acid hydratase in catechol pathway
MTRWIRFRHALATHFGTLEDDKVLVHEGDLFGRSAPTGRSLALPDVELLAPAQPSKIIALWNNFKALGDKLGLSAPPEPLYLLKAPSSVLDPGRPILHPAGVAKVAFEGELGMVIGKTCKAAEPDAALDFVFGYTCANDVTASDVLNRDPSFPQWVRSKSYDTFCPFGPVIATGLDPSTLVVRTLLNGDVRQDYPISDMRVSVAQLVSSISKDMTLIPGDLILCGTSVGVGSMRSGSSVSVEIAGIGTLTNSFE